MCCAARYTLRSTHVALLIVFRVSHMLAFDNALGFAMASAFVAGNGVIVILSTLLTVVVVGEVELRNGVDGVSSGITRHFPSRG